MYDKPKSDMSNVNNVMFFILTVTLTAVAAANKTETSQLSTFPFMRKLNTCGQHNYMQPSRDDYIHTPCIGSHKLHIYAERWNVARKICEEENAYLAIINSLAEAKVLQRIFESVGPAAIVRSSDNYYAAIGFHDLYQENEYVTIHGDSIFKAGYDKWATREPDNAGNNENCGSIHISGGLNDINCNSAFAFICELRQ